MTHTSEHLRLQLHLCAWQLLIPSSLEKLLSPGAWDAPSTDQRDLSSVEEMGRTAITVSDVWGDFHFPKHNHAFTAFHGAPQPLSWAAVMSPTDHGRSQGSEL